MCKESRRIRFREHERIAYQTLSITYRTTLHEHDPKKDTSKTMEQIKKMDMDDIDPEAIRAAITTSRVLLPPSFACVDASFALETKTMRLKAACPRCQAQGLRGPGPIHQVCSPFSEMLVRGCTVA